MSEDRILNKPLSRDEVARRHPARPALREPELAVSFRPMPAPPKPGVRVFPPPVSGGLLERPDRAAVSEVLRGASKRFGARLEDLPADQLRELSSEIAERLAQVSRIQANGTEGFLPDHLPFKPVLPQLEERRRVRPFIGPRAGLQLGRLQPGEFQATTIFPPDQRYLFDDTSFPWCTTGRVDVTGGWGSGTLVGPRHLLCASHMMTWNPDNTVNQVTFTPSYFAVRQRGYHPLVRISESGRPDAKRGGHRGGLCLPGSGPAPRRPVRLDGYPRIRLELGRTD